MKSVSTDKDAGAGLAAMSNDEWILIGWNYNEPKMESTSVTLAYHDGRWSGSAGCNRYFASVDSSDGTGSIIVGGIGSTKMLCPDDIMKTEDRYLEILPKIHGVRFATDTLYLLYWDREQEHALLFTKLP